MKGVAKENISYRKIVKETQIFFERRKTIQQRKGIKHQLLNTKYPWLKEKLIKEYSQKDKKVNRSARKDKRKFIENLVIRTEDASE